MRTIKFRVWAKNDGGFFLPGDSFMFVQGENANGDDYFAPRGISPEVVVVQQFTGLRDKNGREIFEGDRVRATWQYNNPYGYSPDEWDDRHEDFEVKWVGIGFYFPDGQGCEQNVIRDYELEVIGNIFESPK